MKNIFKTILALSAGVAAVSCANQLETSSPSVVDSEFVFSSFETGKSVMLGAYNNYIGIVNNGPTVNLEGIGSDTERASVGLIADLVGASQLYGGPASYEVEAFNINTFNYWGTYYRTIALCNQVIYNIKNLENYNDLIATAPNDWTDLLGQAYALRATQYYDMARQYGDVIYMTENEVGQDITTLTNRDYIIEKEIENLMWVEPMMYEIGKNGHMPDQMTRNYVDGLIGRLCFMEAGYATRRTDLGAEFYKDADGNVITFDVWGTDDARKAQYGRRTDWQKFYTMALPYLERAVKELGGASLTTVDPRSDKQGRTYGNPYQYYFEQINDQIMPNESVYEVTMKQDGGGSRIAYNWGRGSNGGSPAYPPKSNAQICTYPDVFYGMFDPADMRRDVSCTVTGSTGNGAEVMNNFSLSNRITGGIGMNKYDLNRQETPDTRQLYSGINYVLMRQSDIILMLAEAYAQTGNNGAAETELRKVHNRAFPDDVEDDKYSELLAKFSGSENPVLEAIYEERKLEFVGEDRRRWDLVRTGKLPEVAVEFRKQLVDGIAEMKTNGYIQYENGNQFPAYVWTKLVDAKSMLGYRLTMQTPEDVLAGDPTSDEYALLVPGWRGQHDDWASVAVANGADASAVTAGDNTNLAIIGLFEYIDPSSAEAAALEARGYQKTNWGVLTYNSVNADTGEIYTDAAREAQWGSEFMVGYSDEDYAAKKAPIYLIPMQQSVCLTTGLTNGYGFKSK